MTDQHTPPREFGWTAPQRRALLALLTIFLAVLAYRCFTNPAYVPDPQPPEGARAGELASRFDPNVADWHALAAIPGLGEKRAREIVAYRESARTAGGTTTVFRTPADLAHVHGIGKATVENLRPYLIFPTAENASTRAVK